MIFFRVATATELSRAQESGIITTDHGYVDPVTGLFALIPDVVLPFA